MRVKKAWFVGLIILLGLLWSPGQGSCGGQGSKEALLLPPLDRRIQSQFRPPRRGEPLVFAVPHYVSLTPWNSGKWDQATATERIWRLKVKAPGALSLSLGFGRYRMPHGTSLIVRTPDGSELGPFTDKENRSHGQMWTPVLPGEEVELELRISEKMLPFLELELTSVNQGFRPIPGLLGPGISYLETLEKSIQPGSCNVDVACPEAQPWKDEIRSVGLITVGGLWACSGTLVNNTAQDLRPYFLTADHCGITSGNAGSVVVYWNYENSSCGGPSDGSRQQFTQGAYFRAGVSAQQGSDFTLIELAQKPEPTFFSHWSGWDRRDVLPVGGVAIHHPQATEKRISFDEDPLTLATAADALPVDDPSRYLKVGAWDRGTTEPGSSGCGLWNPEHRLVGQLWGGNASCQFPEGSDYFGRLWASWEGGGTSTTRLKDHFDPLGTGQEILDGADGCFPPQVDFTAQPNPAFVGEPVFFESSASGGTPPYTFSWDFNGDGYTDCEESECTFAYSFPYNGDVTLKVRDGQACQATIRHRVSVVERWTTVTLLSPNGGEVLPTGGSFTIQWGAPSKAALFKLLYSVNGGRTWRLMANGVSGSSFEWSVPVFRANKKRCLVKIIGYDSMGRRVGKDKSDDFFAIEVVRLTTIKGNEVLRSGEPYPIAWVTNSTAAPVARVKLVFKARRGSRWKRVATLDGNPASYTWTVPVVARSKHDCWLRVELLDEKNNPLGYDTTDEPFTIEPTQSLGSASSQ